MPHACSLCSPFHFPHFVFPPSLFAPDSCLYLFASFLICLPRFLPRLHSALGGVWRGCPAARLAAGPCRRPGLGGSRIVLGVLVGSAAADPGTLCPAGSCGRSPLQQRVSSVEVGWSYTGHTNPKRVPNDPWCFMDFYFQRSDFPRHVYYSLWKLSVLLDLQAANSDKEQPIGTAARGPAGWTAYLLDWRYRQHGNTKICGQLRFRLCLVQLTAGANNMKFCVITGELRKVCPLALPVPSW